MALEKTSDIIRSAKEHNTAVFSVICDDFNTIYGCIRAAEETQTPVLVQFLPEHDTIYHCINIEGFAGIAKKLASEVKVPIGLHLDHCYTYEEIRRAADAGYSSIMYDGSTYPFEENVARTKEITDEMHARGIWVEGEICPAGSRIGSLAKEWADALGLKEGTAVGASVNDTFGHSGPPMDLLAKYGLTAENIAANAKKAIARK